MAKKATRPATPGPELLDEFEAADYITMSVAFLRADRCRGVLKGRTPGPPYLKLGNTVRYDVRDLDKWLAARRVERPAPPAERIVRARLTTDSVPPGVPVLVDPKELG